MHPVEFIPVAFNCLQISLKHLQYIGRCRCATGAVESTFPGPKRRVLAYTQQLAICLVFTLSAFQRQQNFSSILYAWFTAFTQATYAELPSHCKLLCGVFYIYSARKYT